MNLTRLSLFYLATYLPIAGVALLFAPDIATKLLLSNQTYDDIFPRLTGAVLIALSVLIINIVRYRVEILYGWTLVARAVLLATFVVLYAKSSDPFFLSLFVIVGIGVVLTARAGSSTTAGRASRRHRTGSVGLDPDRRQFEVTHVSCQHRRVAEHGSGRDERIGEIQVRP